MSLSTLKRRYYELGIGRWPAFSVLGGHCLEDEVSDCEKVKRWNRGCDLGEKDGIGFHSE